MRRFDKHCPVRIGDTWRRVCRVLGATGEPKRYLRNRGYQHRDKARGIWVFLDDDQKVRTIRLDKPFAGKIDGLAIGATRAEVIAAKGAAGDDEMMIYNSGGFVRFDLDSKGRVKTILL